MQADLAQLTSDVKTAHDTLVPDFAAIAAAAKAGDRAALQAAVTEVRADAGNVLPAVRADRKQLHSDLEAARDAHLTGIRADVRTALAANRAAIRELHQAAREARQAVRALRRATGTSHS